MRGLAPKLFRLPKISHSLAESVLANFGFGLLGRGPVILSFIRDVYGWGPAVDLQADYCWPQPYTYLFHFILRVQSLEVFGQNTVLGPNLFLVQDLHLELCGALS